MEEGENTRAGAVPSPQAQEELRHCIGRLLQPDRLDCKHGYILNNAQFLLSSKLLVPTGILLDLYLFPFQSLCASTPLTMEMCLGQRLEWNVMDVSQWRDGGSAAVCLPMEKAVTTLSSLHTVGR